MSFKCGETFSYAGSVTSTDTQTGTEVQDFTGWQASCQMRTASDELVDTLDVTWLSRSPGIIKLHKANTTAWPVGTHVIDIRFVSPSGEVAMTKTAQFRVVKPVTRVGGG